MPEVEVEVKTERKQYEGFLVTEQIDEAHPKASYHVLYPGALLTRREGNTWTKEAPGLMLFGFVLTPEQEATLKPVHYLWDGWLEYQLVEET